MAKQPGLNRRQKEVLALLLAGYTQREAAAAVGVTEVTVSRWNNKDVNFIAALNAGLDSLYQAGISELHIARRAAIQMLAQLVQDESTNDAVRLKAIEMTMRFCPQPTGETDPDAIIRGRPWWQAPNLRSLMKDHLLPRGERLSPRLPAGGANDQQEPRDAGE